MAAVKRLHNASQVIILTASTMSERMDAPVARDRSPQQAMTAARCPAASRALFTSAVGITQAKEPIVSKAEKLSEVHLRQFTGSEHWCRHGINRRVVFTDGAKYIAGEGGAYWLLDAIAIAQLYEKSVSGEGSQVWKLTVNPDRSASLVCDDGNHNFVNTHQIEFTDFPIDEIKFYSTDNTILLPSEY